MLYLQAIKSGFIKLGSLLVICLLVSNLHGQRLSEKRKALERQRKALEKEISKNREVLEKTKKEADNSLNQLKLLTTEIKDREQLIDHIGQESFEISIEIEGQRTAVTNLQQDLDKLKLDYGKSLAAAYKKRNLNDKLLVLIDSKSINQAFKRLKYLNQYGVYRQQQAQLILKTQQSIIAALNEMIAKKQEKQGLMHLKTKEKKALEVTKKEEGELLTKLQVQVNRLKQDIQKKEKAASQLNKAISNMIALEIAEAKKVELAKKRADEMKRRKASSLAHRKTTPEERVPATNYKSTNNSYLSAAALKLTRDFESNRGSLPWPVDMGKIVGYFGTHEHPTLKGVKIRNNGVDIKTSKGTGVRAVFGGSVKQIFEDIPGMETVVLINHGEYFSVYAKLSKKFVSKGQNVSEHDLIGEVYTNEEDGTTQLHFELYKQTDLQDPSVWLKRAP